MTQPVQNSVPQLPIDLNMEEVKAQVDEIFKLAQSNSWEHEQFVKKILSGCVAHTVTGLEREANHSLLLYFVAQTSKLDMASINKAHLLFEHGLLIKSIQYEQGTL